DAVAEVEDERPAGERVERRVDGTQECVPACAQSVRIEIALHGAMRLNVARVVASNRPIETDRVDRYAVNITPKQCASAAWEADDLRLGDSPSHLGDDANNGINAPTFKLFRRQHAAPGVENLYRLRSSRNLLNQIVGRGHHQALDH